MKRIALFQICFLGRQYYKMSMTPFIVCDSHMCASDTTVADQNFST